MKGEMIHPTKTGSGNLTATAGGPIKPPVGKKVPPSPGAIPSGTITPPADEILNPPAKP